jgi:hypothetical protein
MTSDVAAAVIAHVGDFADETVLIMPRFGPGFGPGFGEGFAERLESLGAAHVGTLRADERPEHHSASLALMPQIPSLQWASGALERLRDAIITNGRIVCCIGTQHSARPVISFGQMLKAHGFAAIDAAHVGGHLLLSAEVPMFGPRCHA